MTSGEHTKGHTELPWEVFHGSQHGILIGSRKAAWTVAAIAPSEPDDEATHEANAQLIITAVNIYPAVIGVAKGLEAAIRAANLGIFVIRKQGIMPNSSWQAGFEKDLKTATDALTRFREAQAGGGA